MQRIKSTAIQIQDKETDLLDKFIKDKIKATLKTRISKCSEENRLCISLSVLRVDIHKENN